MRLVKYISTTICFQECFVAKYTYLENNEQYYHLGCESHGVSEMYKVDI